MTTITWIIISLLLPAQGRAFSEEKRDVTNLALALCLQGLRHVKLGAQLYIISQALFASALLSLVFFCGNKGNQVMKGISEQAEKVNVPGDSQRERDKVKRV
jgi:hypothetical protein